MTETLIFSDIHGNQAALDALNTATAHEALRYRCLGDAIGYYGRDPAAIWAWVTERDPQIRLGNHEIYIGRCGVPNAPLSQPLRGIGRTALMAAVRHRALMHIPDESGWQAFCKIAWNDARQDEYSERDGRFQVITVHGVPYGSTVYDKAANTESLLPLSGVKDTHPLVNWRATRDYLQTVHHKTPDAVPLLWLGHTHVPMLAVVGTQGVCFQNVQYGQPIEIMSLLETHQAFGLVINPGSVGQPRQGAMVANLQKRTAHAALFDSEQGTVVFLAIDYNFDSTQYARALGLHTYVQIVPADELVHLCSMLLAYHKVSDDDLVGITQIAGAPSSFKSAQAANEALRQTAAGSPLSDAVRDLLRDLWRVEATRLVAILDEPVRFRTKTNYEFSSSAFACFEANCE